ncbi:MAG: hypothetical protein LIO85_07355 [Rikenellaceae bacterium]|nr:hypothetical protein [Rikenellaceae bacterium]
MQANDKILFSERFQELYGYLGLFSYLYILCGGRGLHPDAVVAEPAAHRPDRSAVELLQRHGLLTEREGLLYLNRSMFYSLTVWDLLLIAEPWLDPEASPPDPGGHERLGGFIRSENLSLSYTHRLY